MEALILILGELVFAIMLPLLAIVGEILSAIVAFILSIFSAGKETPTISASATRKITLVVLAMAGLTVGALFVVNQFFFADSVRKVFGWLEDRSGIEIECSEIGGSVFTGELMLEECAIERSGHTGTGFELSLQTMQVDVKLTSLIGIAKIEQATVSGLVGIVDRSHVPVSDNDDTPFEKARRSFVIEDLAIGDIAVTLIGINKDGGHFELPVVVDRAQSAPLRSQYALFDILFRSNANGTVAGAEFEIQTSGDASGRETRWLASDVPVAEFGAVTGGALSWFHDGVVDMRVVDKWRRDGRLEIDMDWNLNFRGVEVRAPETAGTLTKLAAGPIVSYVNRHDGEFPFEFQMTINEDQFLYKSSLAAAGLWTAVGESINALLKKFGFEVTGTGEETGESLKDSAKSVLDRLRKSDDEED